MRSNACCRDQEGGREQRNAVGQRGPNWKSRQIRSPNSVPEVLEIQPNDLIERSLRERAKIIEDLMDANLVTYVGPIDEPHKGMLKSAVESIERAKRKKRIVVNLETGGGYIETAERIANILRHHYRTVDFVVTSFAMSAGTVLVMSGDNIIMDYSATLGPIDPQLPRPGGQLLVPALGYLEQYDRLIEKSRAGSITDAELAYLIQNFDPAELYQYEQARDLSIALLVEWLVKFKFRNWRVTESRGLKVTKAMKVERAQEIAHLLNNTKKWHSHARGITMESARRDLKLEIDDIDDNPEVRDAFSSYNSLLENYRMVRSHHHFVIDWAGGYFGH